MPLRTEYKFITSRLKGLSVAVNEPDYYNWSDVSEMLTRYGANGWTLGQMTVTKLTEDTALCAFVLHRPVGAPSVKKPR